MMGGFYVEEWRGISDKKWGESDMKAAGLCRLKKLGVRNDVGKPFILKR